MSVIDQMSKLILADPNVTARQLAKSLGYAEEKSVYYWLAKAGFRGIKDFKKSVLARSLPAPRRTEHYARDSSDTFMPLFSDTARKALGTGLHQHIGDGLSHESFGVLVTESGCEPLAARGDILLVDPSAPTLQGDLQWASVRGRMRLVRQYGGAGGDTIFVDAIEPGAVVSPDFVSGKVVYIVRKF